MVKRVQVDIHLMDECGVKQRRTSEFNGEVFTQILPNGVLAVYDMGPNSRVKSLTHYNKTEWLAVKYEDFTNYPPEDESTEPVAELTADQKKARMI